MVMLLGDAHNNTHNIAIGHQLYLPSITIVGIVDVLFHLLQTVHTKYRPKLTIVSSSQNKKLL
jgi:hypothetical protein